MKTKFIRDCKGLQLVLSPESDSDRSQLNELVCDHDARLGKAPALRVEFQKDGCKVTHLAIRQKVYLNWGIFNAKRFSFREFNGMEVFYKKISADWYVIFGRGIYRVVKLGKIPVSNPDIIINENQKTVRAGDVVVKYKHAPVIQTLDELEKITAGVIHSY